MSDIVIDTHVAIWHFATPDALSKTAAKIVDEAEANGLIYVSAITLVELVYLVEKNRIPRDVLDLLRSALDDQTTAFHLAELNRHVTDAVERIPYNSIPDMPDRIISATALHLNLPLVTRDSRIRSTDLIQTVW